MDGIQPRRGRGGRGRRVRALRVWAGRGWVCGAGQDHDRGGTPWAGSGGTYAFTLSAGNSVASVTQKFTLTVAQPPLITSADSVTFSVGQSNSFTITTTGFPAATVAEIGPLPSGITLVNKGNGTAILSGKPIHRGSFTFTIVVSDGLLPEALQSFDLTVE